MFGLSSGDASGLASTAGVSGVTGTGTRVSPGVAGGAAATREMAKGLVIAYMVIKIVFAAFLILAVVWGLNILTEYLPYYLYSIDANVQVAGLRGLFSALADACMGIHSYTSVVFDSIMPSIMKLFVWFFDWLKKGIDMLTSVKAPA